VAFGTTITGEVMTSKIVEAEDRIAKIFVTYWDLPIWADVLSENILEEVEDEVTREEYKQLQEFKSTLYDECAPMVINVIKEEKNGVYPKELSVNIDRGFKPGDRVSFVPRGFFIVPVTGTVADWQNLEIPMKCVFDETAEDRLESGEYTLVLVDDNYSYRVRDQVWYLDPYYMVRTQRCERIYEHETNG
jgi:hypothetical protein